MRLTGTPCDERAKLQKICLDAFLAKSNAGRHVKDKNGIAWLQATKQTRKACDAAQKDLKRHRVEHGC